MGAGPGVSDDRRLDGCVSEFEEDIINQRNKIKGIKISWNFQKKNQIFY